MIHNAEEEINWKLTKAIGGKTYIQKTFTLALIERPVLEDFRTTINSQSNVRTGIKGFYVMIVRKNQ